MKYFLNFILVITICNTAFAISSVIRSRTCEINRQPFPRVRDHPSSVLDTTSLNRPAFYKAMQGNNKELVNAQLTELKTLEPKNAQNAFLGTMTMKKAGLGGSPSAKLHLFKEGHKMLEAAIMEDPNNAEFRFLRLLIQENAPGILGYRNNEEKDCEIIRKSYKSLPPDLQHVIADYSKKSKFLKLEVS
ncbi:MAG TPA: hypothetical protein VK772_10200 [Puia sp.]|nr:hypothetical protein [Puia sp.]